MSSLLYTFKAGITALVIVGFSACVPSPIEEDAAISPLFTRLSPESTGITFENTLTEGLNTNVLMYEYFYNGGGVAVGDLNGDGLEDLYFTGNMVPNRLYLNRGNMTFTDITEKSGAVGRGGPWKTGVTMADVNGDGQLDIYVSYSGNVSEPNLINQLYIHSGLDSNGIPTFKEMTAEYGLAIPNNTTQGTFFDFDNDGDLDLLLLNHNPKSLPILDESNTAVMLREESKTAGIRLFRNDRRGNQPYFIDITKQAGIQSSPLTYGLGLGVSDINLDGYLDVYVCNDYSVPDFLYINNKNGTFTDVTDAAIGHTSHSSMGNDIADINNDGLPDIYTLDMLPEGNRRQKLLTGLDNYELFEFNLRMGYRHQYMRNMLQLNQGVQRKNTPVFSEVGQLAGVSNTDWSWAALFADFDNDGWKDLFVTNGTPRDFTNLDFVKYMGDHLRRIDGKVKREDVLELVNKMPSSNMKNYLFRNKGDLTFENMADKWGLSEIANSSGAAYVDLDNDGDLDLIVSNVNQPVSIYRNDAKTTSSNHYLKVKLKGENWNTQGIGAKVKVHAGGQTQYLEQMPTRGYQSSVSPTLHFGLGSTTKIDTVEVWWLSGRYEKYTDVGTDTTLIVNEANAQLKKWVSPMGSDPYFVTVQSPFGKREAVREFNDFKRQPLMVSQLSNTAPVLAKADINGDGKEDLFIGGAEGIAGEIWLNKGNHQWSKVVNAHLQLAKDHWDADATWADMNGDGILDLIVVSGGYGQLQSNASFTPRLYINDGTGQLQLKNDAFGNIAINASKVTVTDWNQDGKLDLFIGSRVTPGRYPESTPSLFLVNDGQGNFTDQKAKLVTESFLEGMITDAKWVDLNQDRQPELVIVGEWMPIKVYTLANGKLTDVTAAYFEESPTGFWNTLLIEDFNKDGRLDIVVGNYGLNSQIKASKLEPAELVFKDFDDNGAIDPILQFYIQGKLFPYITRDEMLDQVSMTRPRFPSYDKYADATLSDIFTAEELKGSTRLEANQLATVYYQMNADHLFKQLPLPVMIQSSPVFNLTSMDVDHDGYTDIIVTGNMNKARLRLGKSDANLGFVLRGNASGTFTLFDPKTIGWILNEDVRSIMTIDKQVIVGSNANQLNVFKLSRK